MNLGLTGKTALVMGGTGLIGQAIAERLGHEGATVYVCGRNERRLQRTLEVLSELSIQAQGRVCDVQDADSVQMFADWLTEQAPVLNVLVNNPGGVMQAGAFREISPETFTAGFNVNVSSIVRVTQAVLPLLERAEWGRVVNMSAFYQSSGDLTLLRRFAENAVAKTAVSTLTKVMSDDLAPKITVNCLSPGPVGEEHTMQSETQVYPVPRVAYPSEIADLVAFLCSYQAGYLTGLTVPVDGGLTRRLA